MWPFCTLPGLHFGKKMECRWKLRRLKEKSREGKFGYFPSVGDGVWFSELGKTQ